MSIDRRDRVLGVVTSVLGLQPGDVVPELTRGVHPAWDSLRHLDLVMELESALGWRLSLDEITSMRTVADILARAERGGD